MRNFCTILFPFWLLAFAGCSLSDDLVLAPLPTADRIEVIRQRGAEKVVGRITDATSVSRVLVYVNHLPEKWHTPWPEPGLAVVRLDFYFKESLVGQFALAPEYFERRGGRVYWCFQNVNPGEIQKLNSAAGIDLLKLADSEQR